MPITFPDSAASPAIATPPPTPVHRTVHGVCKDLHPRPGAAGRPILFLVDQLTELGGGERVMLELARQLPAYGYSPSIAAFRDCPDPAVETLFNHVTYLPLRSSFGPAAASAAWALRSLIRQRRVRLVHTFFETADLYGGLVAKLSGVPHLISSRRDMGLLRSARHRIAYRAMAPLYSAVLAVSEQVRTHHMRADRLRPNRITAIHNGIAPERFARFERPAPLSTLRWHMGIPAGARLVTTVANLNVWKGVDVFLRCAAEVARTRPDTHFAIAGDFTDLALTAELRRLAAALGIHDRTHFLGRVPDVSDLLLSTDIFCLLSRTEGLPNAVLEAMASALPTVATRVGGTPEVIDDGVTGFLVENEDHAAAAHHVLTLLDDPALSKAVGHAARNRVLRDFTVTAMVRKHVELYDSLVSSR